MFSTFWHFFCPPHRNWNRPPSAINLSILLLPAFVGRRPPIFHRVSRIFCFRWIFGLVWRHCESSPTWPGSGKWRGPQIFSPPFSFLSSFSFLCLSFLCSVFSPLASGFVCVFFPGLLLVHPGQNIDCSFKQMNFLKCKFWRFEMKNEKKLSTNSWGGGLGSYWTRPLIEQGFFQDTSWGLWFCQGLWRDF